MSTFSTMEVCLERVTDDDLVKLFCAGDQEAFEVLFDRHHRSVYHYARTLLHDAHEAEDVLQETFLSVAKTAARYEARGRFKAWILRIARNKCLKILGTRKNQWNPANQVVYMNSQLFGGPGPRDRTSAKEEIVLVIRALHTLPESQKEAILLRVRRHEIP